MLIQTTLIVLSILAPYLGIFRTQPVGKEMVYTVPAPVRVIVTNLLDKFDKGPSHKDGPILPPIVKNADLDLKADLMPKRGYYKFNVQLLTPYDRAECFDKQIELWDKGTHTVVRSSIYLQTQQSRFPLRWINGIKNRVTNGIEDEILNLEKEKIMELAR